MNIVIFNWRDLHNPWAGGSELNVHEMAKRWVSKGHSVTMLCVRSNAGWKGSRYEVYDGIKFIRLGNRYFVYLLAPLYYLLRLRNSTDRIVDVENGIPFFTPLFARKKVICLVNHVHNKVFFSEAPFPFSLIGYALERYGMPFVYRKSKFVCISQSTRNDLLTLRLRKEQISVVYAGVDHSRFVPLNNKYSDPTVLYLGKIKRYKNVHLLIPIFKNLLKSIPNAKLIIAGDGYDLSYIKSLVKENRLESCVNVMGEVSEEKKVELYQKSWIAVTPSSIEGWGLTVIEANACGLPVFAFNVPGLSESIVDGYSGTLVSTQNKMIESIVEFLSNRVLRETYSKNAIMHASQFDWEKSSEALLAQLI